MAYLGMSNPDTYRRAVRQGCAQWYTVDATYNGSPVVGATGLQPTGGTVTDTSKPGVRRVLNLELPGDPRTYDLLSPIGTTLKAWTHVQMTDRTVIDIPMGVFDIDEQSISEAGGAIRITAPDKWVRVQRAKFIVPGVTTTTLTVAQQLTLMIRDALGSSEPVNVLTANTTPVPQLTWDSDDRADAMIGLAKDIGCWVYFDRGGTATIADLPTLGPSADWQVDSGSNGVVTSLDRSRSRTSTRNVVALDSSSAGAAAFPMAYVWDNDPASPTYAGTDPVHSPGSAGPFGVSVYHYSTPLPLNSTQATATAKAILSQTVGLASSVSLGSVPNAAIDAMDVIDVLPPGSQTVVTGYVGSSPVLVAESTRAWERHMVDTVTHPLSVTQGQQIAARSTRTDPYT